MTGRNVARMQECVDGARDCWASLFLGMLSIALALPNHCCSDTLNPNTLASG